MYETISHELYWPHMANEFYMTVSDSRDRARNRASLQKKRNLRLFPANVPLELISMDVLGTLQKTEPESVYHHHHRSI